MKTNTATLLASLGLLWGSATWAGFDITRMTTVVDDHSGSYTITKNGRLDEGLFAGTSVTEFNGFHPGKGESEAVISGVITKNSQGGNGAISTTADGSFTLTAEKGEWEVTFEALQIQISDEGVVLAGTIVANENSYDAADLPEDVSRVLRRVFWLTRR